MKTETELLEDYCNLTNKIDKRIEAGFSYRVLEPLFDRLYRTKEKLEKLSKVWSVLLSESDFMHGSYLA